MNLYRSFLKFLHAVLGAGAVAFSCNAQSLTSEAVASAGNEMLTPNAMLSYTIGEPAVSYWNTGGAILTEGFQQNEVLITAVSATPDAANVNVYPNPFALSFNVDFPANNEYALVVTDALGKIVKTESNLTGVDRYTMDMQNAAAGVYYLSVQNKARQPVAVYKLVKSTP